VFLVETALRLENLDAELTVAADGEKMLQLLEEMEAGKTPRPDIVLLDLNLPRYSGAELLERLRQSPQCGQTPVIIMTSSDAPCDRDVALRLRANGYFRKPSDYAEFMRLGGLVRCFAPGG
jgi:chemotaxis family two-component system response regulator Rcp1